MENPNQISEQFAALERRQARTSRWLRFLGALVIVQTVVIAYTSLPIGGAIKHPLTLQAGRFEAIDRNGVVRAVLTADDAQTILELNDPAGRSQILLRENKSGFATMEFFNRATNEKAATLFAGSKRAILELHDPSTRQHLRIQAGEGELGLTRYDERGQVVP